MADDSTLLSLKLFPQSAGIAWTELERKKSCECNIGQKERKEPKVGEGTRHRMLTVRTFYTYYRNAYVYTTLHFCFIFYRLIPAKRVLLPATDNLIFKYVTMIQINKYRIKGTF